MDLGFIIFIINFIFSLIYILVVLRALLPWISNSRQNPVLGLVYAICDPFLNVIRFGLPPKAIGMDVSPFIILILVYLIHQFILQIIL